MAFLSAVEHALPEKKVTNEELSGFMDTSDEWIRTRSGIRERRWVREGNRSFVGLTNHDLVYQAARRALESVKLNATDLDLICYATISPDNEMPGSGAFLKRALRVENIPVFEIRNQCSGFLYALQVAAAYINNGKAKNCLVIGAEIQSTGLDLSNKGRNTAVLFADGAGAAILSSENRDNSARLLGVQLFSDGKQAEKLGVSRPGFQAEKFITLSDFEENQISIYPFMDGKFVFKSASLRMPEAVRSILKEHGLTIAQLKVVIPHQANQRIIEMLSQDLGPTVRVFSNIGQYGNTTAASIPIALSEARLQGLILKGDLVCLVSFGAGFSWGAALLKW